MNRAEMLAALKAADLWWDSAFRDRREAARAQVRAAIEHAEGCALCGGRGRLADSPCWRCSPASTAHA